MNLGRIDFNQLRNNPGQVQAMLAQLHVDYPITKDELIARAEEENVNPQVIERLHRLPDRPYENTGELVEQLARLR